MTDYRTELDQKDWCFCKITIKDKVK